MYVKGEGASGGGSKKKKKEEDSGGETHREKGGVGKRDSVCIYAHTESMLQKQYTIIIQ